MKAPHVLAAAGLLAASTAASAGTLAGNVGVVSDYLFRGIDQSAKGAAVQGGVDYSADFGLYTGLWVSNNALGGGNEADLYAGYDLKLGLFSVDAGLIYYAYTEDTEAAAPSGSRGNTDFAEVFAGAGVGPIALKVFYTNAFGRDQNALGGIGGLNVSGDPDRNEALYATASATLEFNDTLSIRPQVGVSAGKGVKDAFGDEYTDYSLTATKKLKDDLSASLAVVGTDLKDFNGITGNKDGVKFVIGFKKGFKI